jgi:VCBS repeat-containing protein
MRRARGQLAAREYPARPHLLLEALEPRILLSADPFGVGLDVAPSDDPDRDASYEPLAAAEPDPTARRELVVIDPAVEDYETLLRGISGDGEVDILVLETGANALEQVGRRLAEGLEYDAVHLIAHGSAGEVQLAGTTLGLDTLQAHEDALRAWAQGLAAGADVLVYGCDVTSSADGRALVERIATLTGADVAASDDRTGNATLGGDWDLEYQHGSIGPSAALAEVARSGWSGTLNVDPTATGDSYSVDEDGSLVVDQATSAPTANLVGWWDLDQTSPSQTATDGSGSGVDGTLGSTAGVDSHDPVWTTSSKVGTGALSFDGANDYVQTTSSTLKTASSFTISAWFQTDTTTGQHHLVWQGVGTQNGWGNPGGTASTDAEMHLTVGKHNQDDVISFFYGYDDANPASIDIVSANNFTDTSGWHHAAVVVTDLGGGTVSAELFVDGVSEGTDTGTQIDRSAWDTDLRLGRPGAAMRYFDGAMDEVRVYDRAISTAEVGELWQAGVLVNDSDADGDALTVNTTPVVGPTDGTLTLLADGTFTYTPDANFNGTDSFTYEVSDGNGGSSQATVTISVDPVNDSPTGSVTIDDTTPAQGDTLNASSTLADVDGLSGAISYQWQRGGGDISGATGSSYVTTPADVGAVITVVASYTDDLGTAESVVSAATATVTNFNNAPTGSVTIDNTTPAQGDTLTASNTLADVDGLSGAIGYQWQRGGVNISGATGSTYVTSQADVGTIITVIASYTDDVGNAETLSSSGTAAVAVVSPAKAPPLSGLEADEAAPANAPVQALERPALQEIDPPSLTADSEPAPLALPESTGNSVTGSGQDHLPEPVSVLDAVNLVLGTEEPRPDPDQASVTSRDDVRAILLAPGLGAPALDAATMLAMDPMPETARPETSTERLRTEIARMTREMDEGVAQASRTHALLASSTQAIVGTLSAGYLTWMLRASSLLASALASLPMWARFDPLPVLARARDEDERTQTTVSAPDSDAVETEAERKAAALLGTSTGEIRDSH